MRNKGRGIGTKMALAVVAVAACPLIVAGCAQQNAAENTQAEEPQYANSYEEAEGILAERNARQDEINKEYAPEVRTLEDGTKVQRTPTEYQCYHWNRPYEGGTSYNNYYLDADNRGCNACHERS